jgi:hypothetical protein
MLDLQLRAFEARTDLFFTREAVPALAREPLAMPRDIVAGLQKPAVDQHDISRQPQGKTATDAKEDERHRTRTDDHVARRRDREQKQETRLDILVWRWRML